MNVYFGAPKSHLSSVLEEFDFNYVDSISEADVWVCDPLVAITKNKLRRHKHLWYLATPSTGTNHIPLLECEKHDIIVLSLLDDREGLDTITASSEFTLWHILGALRHGGWRQLGRYERNDDVMRGSELAGKSVGIVGFGRIGQNIDRWVRAMGANHTITHDKEHHWPEHAGQHFAGLTAVFTCDIVVICCSLTDETRGLITWDHLKDFHGILVNTARAEIIDERSLLLWCKRGGRYSTDVLHGEAEGRANASSLLKLPNVIITPHVAGTTFESQEKAARIILGLLDERSRT